MKANAAARALGLASASAATPEQRQDRASKGGKASSRALTKAQRKARAKRAAAARWAKARAAKKIADA
jgi:hypothetical protein